MSSCRPSLGPIDRLIVATDSTLRVLSGSAAGTGRPSPAAGLPRRELSDDERRHAAGLMRINHAGEIAAQGLYQGQALMAESPDLRDHLLHAAAEEADHLRWCEDRLRDLQSRPSLLSPLWFGGALLMGALAGSFGRSVSLGFVSETERQVEEHLSGHLQTLPPEDEASRAVVQQMMVDEGAHGQEARDQGGRPVPSTVQQAMRASAQVMIRTAYWA